MIPTQVKVGVASAGGRRPPECLGGSGIAHAYAFPTFTLDAGAYVNVWVKTGTNTATDLYWGRGSAVWNNDTDCAYLRDAGGTPMDTYRY